MKWFKRAQSASVIDTPEVTPESEYGRPVGISVRATVESELPLTAIENMVASVLGPLADENGVILGDITAYETSSL